MRHKDAIGEFSPLAGLAIADAVDEARALGEMPGNGILPAIDFVTIEPPLHGTPADIAGRFDVRLADGYILSHPIRRADRIHLLKRLVEVLFRPEQHREEEE